VGGGFRAVTVAAMRRRPASALRRRPATALWRRPLALAGTLALAVALTGCSGNEPAAKEQTPTEQLAAAQAAFDSAKTVQLDLTSRNVPPRQNGVTRAKGAGVIDPTTPKFQGTITGTIKGIGGTIDVIAIGEDTYLKFFTPDYTKTDFDTLNAPNPAMFFDPTTGISALLPQTTDPKDDGQTRAGTEVLDKISGTLPGSTIEQLFHLGDGTGTYAVSYGITDTDQLRTATLTGPFFPGSESTYVLTLTDYGTPVEITSP
jgi:lipoprotein LprG